MAIHGIELEVETLRVMAYREGTWTEDLEYRMMTIQDLEETCTEALEQTISVQADRREKNRCQTPVESHNPEGRINFTLR